MTRRYPHGGRPILRNHACQRPTCFLFVDTETRPIVRQHKREYIEHSLRLGVSSYVRWERGREPVEQWSVFTDVRHFWEFVQSVHVSKRRLWVIAHNAAFDFTVLKLWDRIECGEYRIKDIGKHDADGGDSAGRHGKQWQGIVCIDGHPFHIQTRSKWGNVCFSDLMNYYKCSLAEVGKSIGVDKLPMPEQHHGDDVWEVYCRRDVEILKTAYLNLVKQWESEDNGNWQFTAPALSWSTFRHKHYTTEIVPHQHANATDLEWSAYYGGENRSFYRGTCPGSVVHYDVSSLYPWVMREYEYPTELIDYILCPNVGIVESLMQRYGVIADVTLECSNDWYPKRTAERVHYPIGVFRTQLCGPELQCAWRSGCVKAIHSASYYKTGRVFIDFVESWYARKAAAASNGRRAAEHFCKLILNSLQGKFAQRTQTWQLDPRVEVIRPWKSYPWKDRVTGQQYLARSIGWNGQLAIHRAPTAHTFPAVSAFITAYARTHMRNLRKLIPPSSLYYQDTDSLIIENRSEAYRDLELHHKGDGIGQLRIVGIYSACHIRGPKNYTADGQNVISGVSKRDRECRSMEWTAERFEGAGEIVTREPDGVVRSFIREFSTPGTCLEGGYRDDGFYFPVKLP